MNMELASTLPQLAAANPYRTNDLDAARAHIGAMFVPHDLNVVGRHQVLDVCISCMQMEGVSFIYHRHGAAVRVRPPPLRDFFLLQIPMRGDAAVRVGDQRIECSPRQGFMISPTLEADMLFGQSCEQLIIRVEKSDLERYLETQLGRVIVAPLEFAPAVSLLDPGGRELTRLLLMMTQSLTDDGALTHTSPASTQMTALLFSALLRCLDHNYRDELGGGQARSRPAYLTAAHNFMRQRLSRQIGPEEIANAVHVSTRALFVGFQTHLNTSPMRYLKELRLNAVREMLLSLDPRQASVTTVAMDCGFHHLGHFCAAYKDRFGEQPRETLSKSQRKLPRD